MNDELRQLREAMWTPEGDHGPGRKLWDPEDPVAPGAIRCPTGVACSGCRYCENLREAAEILRDIEASIRDNPYSGVASTERRLLERAAPALRRCLSAAVQLAP